MERTNANWYTTLVSECNTMAEKFGLDDGLGQELRDFVIRIAREQYKIGNHSGIVWLKREQAKAADKARLMAGQANANVVLQPSAA